MNEIFLIFSKKCILRDNAAKANARLEVVEAANKGMEEEQVEARPDHAGGAVNMEIEKSDDESDHLFSSSASSENEDEIPPPRPQSKNKVPKKIKKYALVCFQIEKNNSDEEKLDEDILEPEVPSKSRTSLKKQLVVMVRQAKMCPRSVEMPSPPQEVKRDPDETLSSLGPNFFVI